MNYTLGFARICFFLVCMICTVMYTLSNPAGGEAGFSDLFLGVGFGSLIGATLVGIDLLLRPYHLRELLTVIVGLLVGYALGRIVWLLVENSVPRGLDPAGTFLSTARLSITLTSCYLGLVFASRSSDEWYLSLPFVRLKPQTTKKRDVLLDPSTLCDPRIIDLAASGLVDQQLVLPRFVMNDLFSQAELGDDSIRMRARKAIETVRKL
ncbi:MAG: hypothetical protein KDK78_11575, partial [Chlamydiia bacterium]|nr:hypothetical protein [Chlamydiia bacterium]